MNIFSVKVLPYRMFLRQKGGSRTASEEARRLLDWMKEYQTEVLRFLRDSLIPYVPFDNNQAGRDLLMVKIEQRISGAFQGKKDVHVLCLRAKRHLDIKKQKNEYEISSSNYSQAILTVYFLLPRRGVFSNRKRPLCSNFQKNN